MSTWGSYGIIRAQLEVSRHETAVRWSLSVVVLKAEV